MLSARCGKTQKSVLATLHFYKVRSSVVALLALEVKRQKSILADMHFYKVRSSDVSLLRAQRRELKKKKLKRSLHMRTSIYLGATRTV